MMVEDIDDETFKTIIKDFQEFKPVSIERVIARNGTDINEEVGA